ncbi:uncharacterized protein SPSK_06708 [Sporothrix schenckii 1099-18]|uniref:Uncharacterized protein n=1 Tax=Sporothrix schenckii 1099-18 TaxID=1397361 RepID=A0A0F2MJF7_SPOSC|nr:uncharacterized protein SPSK_06708 [Sporothrix schenckii 1099-18]KJR89757.1 hypothetical protein SPSK_06708 [Sporothrix schenckii 1099-18]
MPMAGGCEGLRQTKTKLGAAGTKGKICKGTVGIPGDRPRISNANRLLEEGLLMKDEELVEGAVINTEKAEGGDDLVMGNWKRAGARGSAVEVLCVLKCGTVAPSLRGDNQAKYPRLWNHVILMKWKATFGSGST